MASDEPRPAPVEPAGYDQAELEDEARSQKRSLWSLLPVLLAIIIAIVALLLLRDCAATAGRDGDENRKTIEDVSGMEPVAGVVSLWIEQDADVDEVLAAAGVSADDRIDLGDGRFVLDVAPGSESGAVTALEKTPGVNDAGRVFEQP